MVFVLLAVLIGAAYVGLASGTQYGDYAAAKMPQYGSEEYHEPARDRAPINDDYQDRSLEAPASPDYKYEESLNLRSLNSNNEEEKRKSNKRTSRFQRPEATLHSKADKVKPKVKQPSPRQSKWRNSDKSVEIKKIPLNSGRIKSNDIIDKEDDYINDERYQVRFDDEKRFRSVGEKIVRRKPRDRSIASTENETDDMDDDDEDEGKERDEAKEGEYPASEDNLVPKEHSGQSLLEAQGQNAVKRPTLQVDDDIIARLEANKLNQKTQEDYQDYYDMKRVNNIKKKITVLYRRTKARATGSTTSRRVQVWTYRRSYVLDRYGTPTSEDEDLPMRTTARMRTKKRNKTRQPIKWRSKTDFNTETFPTFKIAIKTKFTTSSISTTTITTAETPTVELNDSSSSELSLAEKSRLSILKKAMLKESLLDKSSTVKPPVLMQVSQQMNTVVMVEPSKPNVNMQLMGNLGRSLFDSPARLARAKRLMRRKLVAGARSIQDLTDKWDEMICDYIDVSQLDSSTKNTTGLRRRRRWRLRLPSGSSVRYWVHTDSARKSLTLPQSLSRVKNALAPQPPRRPPPFPRPRSTHVWTSNGTNS
ncbi:unnamed protein product, partial [Iphiclides podalirius]